MALDFIIVLGKKNTKIKPNFVKSVNNGLKEQSSEENKVNVRLALQRYLKWIIKGFWGDISYEWHLVFIIVLKKKNTNIKPNFVKSVNNGLKEQSSEENKVNVIPQKVPKLNRLYEDLTKLRNPFSLTKHMSLSSN